MREVKFEEARNWFIESRAVIREAFGEDFDLFCKILAATSIISTIESNIDKACKVYRQIKLDGQAHRSALLNSQWVTLDKLLNNKNTAGRKAWSLYQNLIGNENVCPIDRWMLRFYGYSESTLRSHPQVYDEIENKIKEEATKLGITPAQRQAQIWCSMRNSLVSYGSIIRKKGITKVNLLRRLC